MEDIFRLGASAAASEFCEWVRVRIDVYIPHLKYWIKALSSSWFSAACVDTIADRNHLFFLRLYQGDKSSDSKVKGFLNLPNLDMLLNQKSPSFCRNVAVGTLGELLIVFSTKINLLYLLYSTARRRYLLHLIK